MNTVNRVKNKLMRRGVFIITLVGSSLIFWAYADAFYTWYKWYQDENKQTEVIGKVKKIKELKGKRRGEQYLHIELNEITQRFDSYLSAKQVKTLRSAGEEVIVKFYIVAMGRVNAYEIIGKESGAYYYKGKKHSTLLSGLFVFVILFLIFIAIALQVRFLLKVTNRKEDKE